MRSLPLWVCAAVLAASVASSHAQGTFFKNRVPLGPEPVTRLEDVPAASWSDLAIYSGQRLGVNRLASATLDEWSSYANCEQFQKDRSNPQQLAANRDAMRTAIAARAVPQRVRLFMDVSVRDFDARRLGLNVMPLRKGDGVGGASGDTACRNIRNMSGLTQLPTYIEIRLSDDTPWYPAVSGDAAFAEKTLKELGGRNLRGDLVVELTGVADSPRSNVPSGRIMARPIALFLFLDDERTKLVAALGRAAPGAEQRRPAVVAPSAAKEAAVPASVAPPASSAPPPDIVEGRVEAVPDTATLTINGQAVPLFGISGFGNPYDGHLLKIIGDLGGAVKCTRRGDRYVCIVGGYDIAVIALHNGGARALADAPAEYLDVQAKAAAQQIGVHKRQ